MSQIRIYYKPEMNHSPDWIEGVLAYLDENINIATSEANIIIPISNVVKIEVFKQEDKQ